MRKKRKSSIRVTKKTFITDGASVKTVTPVSPRKKEQPLSSTTLAKNIANSKKPTKSFKPGEKLWKNVPSAIRYAKSRQDPRLEISDERVDLKLKEMCDKVFISKELPNRSYTLEEIGNYVGVSRERIRQIQESALNNLRAEIRDEFGWELDPEDILSFNEVYHEDSRC
jgi:hypothetical protein